jgi:hypothetical protein
VVRVLDRVREKAPPAGITRRYIHIDKALTGSRVINGNAPQASRSLEKVVYAVIAAFDNTGGVRWRP